MGQPDRGSSGAAIAVIVVGGVVVLLLLGCVGLGAMSFLFVARSSPPQVATATVQSSPPMQVDEVPEEMQRLRVITSDANGLAEIDGVSYSDDELRSLLAGPFPEGEAPQFVVQLADDLAADRRAAIEQIVREAQPTVPPVEVAPAPAEELTPE
jgi:hypothetical protein